MIDSRTFIEDQSEDSSAIPSDLALQIVQICNEEGALGLWANCKVVKLAYLVDDALTVSKIVHHSRNCPHIWDSI